METNTNNTNGINTNIQDEDIAPQSHPEEPTAPEANGAADASPLPVPETPQDSSDQPVLPMKVTVPQPSLQVLPFSAMSSKGEYAMKTAPFDSRFPNQNQTRNCWQNYVDYHRCKKIKGEDYEPCDYFKRVFKSLCPNAWVEKWDEQVQNGTFAGKI